MGLSNTGGIAQCIEIAEIERNERWQAFFITAGLFYFVLIFFM